MNHPIPNEKIPKKQAIPLPEASIQTFFEPHPGWRPSRDSLTDQPVARRIFRQMEWSVETGLYPYQAALESASGPEVEVQGKRFLQFSASNYLGLLGHPEIQRAAIEAIEKYGTTTAGVRLLTGTHQLHQQLETALADLKKQEGALTFSSGFLANLAVISSLFNKRDFILADAHINRSVIDAIQLAGVPFGYFQHNNTKDLEQHLQHKKGRRTLIISEGIFSLNGDTCPLPELVYLKNKYKAFLMIDEAHSFGVLGRFGEGIHGHFGIPSYKIDLITGSLAKAIPSVGGFVLASRQVQLFLQHRADPFMFSSALPPGQVAASLKAVELLPSATEQREQLHQNSQYLLAQLEQLGLPTGRAQGPIFPVGIGDQTQTLRVAARLRAEGILVAPIFFPATPLGAGCLRICVSAAHQKEQLDRLISALKGVQH